MDGGRQEHERVLHLRILKLQLVWVSVPNSDQARVKVPKKIAHIMKRQRPLRRHHTVGFGVMNHEAGNSNVYCGVH